MLRRRLSSISRRRPSTSVGRGLGFLPGFPLLCDDSECVDRERPHWESAGEVDETEGVARKGASSTSSDVSSAGINRGDEEGEPSCGRGDGSRELESEEANWFDRPGDVSSGDRTGARNGDCVSKKALRSVI